MALESAVNIVLPLTVRLIFTLENKNKNMWFMMAVYLHLLGKVYKQLYKYKNIENAISFLI